MNSMEIDNKYYVPNVSDLYLGFEYQYFEHFNKEIGEWVNCVINDNFSIYQKASLIGVNMIRVKYLDRNDIEELGFKHSLSTLSNGFDTYDFGIYQLLQRENNNILIEEYMGRRLFDGIIKNKSELKILLKQLEII